MFKYSLQVEPDSFLGVLDTEMIKDTEDTFHREFPADYIEFLKEYNGVRLVHSNIKLANGENLYISRFLAIRQWADEDDEYDEYDIRVFTNETASYYFIDPNYKPGVGYKYSGPKGYPFIPIATTDTDNTVVLDFRNDPQNPKVALWIAKESVRYSPVTKPIADSFDAFMQLIVSSQPH